MNKIHRFLILGVLVFLAVLTGIFTILLNSSDSGTSTGSDSSPMFLMVIIAGLVFVIIPVILVITRFIKR
ncbi:MAG: hypothetical protein ACFFAU_14110 [Candidatus Hodarchaeota archaeon]